MIPCDISGMEMAIRLLDPWQSVLNIPCWQVFMWETILCYRSRYNEAVLKRIATTKWKWMEEYARTGIARV